MGSPTFPFAEAVLCDRMGVAKKSIRLARADALEQGADWEYEGRDVCYSEAGVRRLLESLRIAPETAAAVLTLVEENSGAGGQGMATEAAKNTSDDVADLVMVRRFSANHRLVLARHGDQDARVRVRDAEKLRPGMMLPCRRIEGDLWELARALPRWAGKW